MRSFVSLRWLGCILAASAAALAVGTVLLFNFAVDRYVIRDAERQAHSWGVYFSEHLPDLAEIASGNAPSEESLSFIREAANVGNVFRFKLFDHNGILRLVSDELEKGAAESVGGSLRQHNPTAANVLANNEAYTKVKSGQPPKRPHFYAESYIPVRSDGRTIAVVEVYVDQTAAQSLARTEFTWVGLALMGITLTAFLIPGAAFYRRTRQKMRADEKVHFLAHHDSMTGLMNRANFADTLTARLAEADGADTSAAVLYVDIDHFKEVNDSLGHDVGDELIFETGERLRAFTSGNDLVARFGGDEFALVRFGIDSAEAAEAYAEKLLRSLARPVATENHEVSSTASIGISVAPKDGTTAHQLFKCADIALYEAKANGRNRFVSFTPEMNESLARRRRLEISLRNAIETGRFELHYQPLFDSDQVNLTGFEALLRLTDDKLGPVPPTEFVPIAEEMGLISQIGEWVLVEACTVAAQWPTPLRIAVNLSPQQFRENGVVESVSKALAASGLDPRRLELEITESLLMHDTGAVLHQLSDLKQRGISIVMDDFGTGYSSLSYLWRFPFDKLKIDRSFLTESSQEDPNVRNILQTIVTLGHSMGMTVTAEGVETPTQARLLTMLSCDHLQGFHLGRPMPQTHLAAAILKNFQSDRQLDVGRLSETDGPGQAGEAGDAERSA